MANARYNKFGTPASLTGKLATGLSKDPETAARQYLSRNRATFAATADSLETLATTPVGKGAVVLHAAAVRQAARRPRRPGRGGGQGRRRPARSAPR